MDPKPNRHVFIALGLLVIGVVLVYFSPNLMNHIECGANQFCGGAGGMDEETISYTLVRYLGLLFITISVLWLAVSLFKRAVENKGNK